MEDKTNVKMSVIDVADLFQMTPLEAEGSKWIQNEPSVPILTMSQPGPETCWRTMLLMKNGGGRMLNESLYKFCKILWKVIINSTPINELAS